MVNETLDENKLMVSLLTVTTMNCRKCGGPIVRGSDLAERLWCRHGCGFYFEFMGRWAWAYGGILRPVDTRVEILRAYGQRDNR